MLSITVDARPALMALRDFEVEAQRRLNDEARDIAAEIRDQVKALAPVSRDKPQYKAKSGRVYTRDFPAGTYRDSIVALPDPRGGGGWIVQSRLPPSLGALNLDDWLEFGTSTMTARPHFMPVEEQYTPRWNARVRQILEQVGRRVGRR